MKIVTTPYCFDPVSVARKTCVSTVAYNVYTGVLADPENDRYKSVRVPEAADADVTSATPVLLSRVFFVLSDAYYYVSEILGKTVIIHRPAFLYIRFCLRANVDTYILLRRSYRF